VTEPRTCEFGDVYIDFSQMTVKRAGAVVDIEPKMFDVLLVLIANRDLVVTKDELQDGVWRDTFVTPNALTRAVAQLRKALGDDADHPRYIETVSKRGYHFIGPIVTNGGSTPAIVSAAGVSLPTRRRSAGLMVATLAATAVLVGGTFLWVARRRRLEERWGRGADHECERTQHQSPGRPTATRSRSWANAMACGISGRSPAARASPGS
jgi:DNA-binding winged helix-turn-helix (wHTH) protein